MAKHTVKAPAAEGSKHIKRPSTESHGSSNREHPIFCLRHLENIKKCEREVLYSLATKLHEQLAFRIPPIAENEASLWSLR